MAKKISFPADIEDKMIKIRTAYQRAEAWLSLGHTYWHTKNYEQAVPCFLKVINQTGNTHARISAYEYVGRCYLHGLGLPRNAKKAYEYFLEVIQNERDADPYTKASCVTHIGWCYYNGDGIEKNYKVASDYFLEASEQTCNPLAKVEALLGLVLLLGASQLKAKTSEKGPSKKPTNARERLQMTINGSVHMHAP